MSVVTHRSWVPGKGYPDLAFSGCAGVHTHAEGLQKSRLGQDPCQFFLRALHDETFEPVAAGLRADLLVLRVSRIGTCSAESAGDVVLGELLLRVGENQI